MMLANGGKSLARRIGKRIQGLRHANGWGQVDLEAHLDGALTRSTISYLETGSRLPSLRTLQLLADAFGVHPATFLLGPREDLRERVADAVLSCSERDLRRIDKLLKP